VVGVVSCGSRLVHTPIALTSCLHDHLEYSLKKSGEFRRESRREAIRARETCRVDSTLAGSSGHSLEYLPWPALTCRFGTANDTTTALAVPTDSPAIANALRDDLAANLVPAVNNNFAERAQ
jgi:hypothetical protein